MHLARVIGTVWATKKNEALEGFKLLIIQPINSKKESINSPIIAVDTIGAGYNEIVIYSTSSEAPIPMKVGLAPVDASIVGIVDSIYNQL
ncbi:MAG TPA: EutN/CcmL family microcompartment protein [Ignavibacteriales bacterium]|nr:EutN/CcmL family microcompartment protein [Ignavibacteriales bacterium]HOL80147.1 EutN/CcmL family microcompartment protein [Ignavibacteriales bacterium]HOM64429.1 EutN/CcmL family microcompartment protein [Ignavibacteriales bacterium]HPD67916.1 EutN/CcmL family microcompartment protein [Ignavibacteriales bacterium]HPP32336.1 EutN/CcmL family microcompartment protein [Ignavibacteriales bacterium]